jgi:ABC-2 type transport system ATP-binding protein
LLIGYCPQENIYYPKLTCLEQLMFIGQMYNLSLRQAKHQAAALLDRLGLKDKSGAYAGKLSGGMKRRLNICLALIHDPEILILDEPEAGLDPQSRVLVREYIRELGSTKTIILTTHNMDEADRLADRVAIIDHGKLLLLDTPQKLKRTIGEGDILEVVFDKGDDSSINRYANALIDKSLSVTRGPGFLLIKHPEIIGHLPEVKMLADSMDLTIAEIKLRENSLEDVFIHLTGRNLRE